jgi:uncharacterized FlaG/YvyC family protein
LDTLHTAAAECVDLSIKHGDLHTLVTQLQLTVSTMHELHRETRDLVETALEKQRSCTEKMNTALEKGIIEMESRLEKKLDKRIVSNLDRRLKAVDDVGMGIVMVILLCLMLRFPGSKIDDLIKDCTGRCLFESQAVVEQMLDEFNDKQEAAVAHGIATAVADAAGQHFRDVALKCEGLMVSTAESVSLSRIRNAEKTTQNTPKEVLDDINAQWELQREAQEKVVLETVERTVRKLSTEMEFKIEKKLEKKLLLSSGRNLKQQEDVGELNTR